MRLEQVLPVPQNEPWRHWMEDMEETKATTTTQPPVAVELKQAPPTETTAAREAIRELAELTKELLDRRETSTLDQVQSDLELVSTLLQCKRQTNRILGESRV